MAPAPKFGSSSDSDVRTIRAIAILILLTVCLVSNISRASAQAVITATLSVSNGNVIIEDLSVTPSSASQGAQLQIDANVINDGTAATTNMIFNMFSTGPASSSANQPILSLSPGQSELVSITVSGLTSAVGSYTLTANVDYAALQATNLISNNATTSYSVSGSGGGGGGGGGGGPVVLPVPPPTSIASITFPEVPIYISVFAGNVSVSQMAIQNNANNYVWVNLTTSPLAYGYLTFSTSSLYIPPQQTVLLNVVFTPKSGAPMTTFLAPINFSVTSPGGRPAQASAYLDIRIKNSSSVQPVFTRATSLQNYSKQVLTQLKVYNPTNRTLYGSVISTTIPFLVATNINQFILSGGVSNVSIVNNQYVLTWRIPILQPKNNVFLYYAVNNVQNPQYFTEPITTLTVPTQVTGNVKVFNIAIPTFYQDQAGKISLNSLYVGTNQTNVTFDLSGPSTVLIPNPEVVYRAVPNTAMNPSFNVSGIPTTGTYILQLTIRAAGINQSYSLPVIVLTPQQLQAQSTTTTVPQNSAVFPNIDRVYLALAILSIAAIWGAAELLRRGGKGRYSNDRAKKLIRMREQIKRTGGESNE